MREAFLGDCSAPQCQDHSLPDVPVPICAAHYAALVRHYLTLVGSSGIPVEVDGQAQAPAVPEESRSIEQVVYFVRFGAFIKVGITNSLARRLNALPVDEVLAVQRHATRQDEKSWHQRLAQYRHRGEWFHDVPEVRAMIAEVHAA